MSNLDEKIRQAIPAEFHMISGSHDSQTSADAQNVGQFQLPNPSGRAGGACTSALLKVLYKDGQAAGSMSWVESLRQMRTELNKMGFNQVPQLTSSRLIDVNKEMRIVPENATGRRRALLIGINYTGQQGQLSGCHNDVGNIKQYLIKVLGFKESEMLILMDDGRHHAPTRANIEDAFKRITQYSQAGDVVFVHYSGHGGAYVVGLLSFMGLQNSHMKVSLDQTRKSSRH
jgi:metacaspase-1